MSEISDMGKPLDGVEVEWKALGEICKIETGKLNADAAVDGGAYMFLRPLESQVELFKKTP